MKKKKNKKKKNKTTREQVQPNVTPGLRITKKKKKRSAFKKHLEFILLKYEILLKYDVSPM